MATYTVTVDSYCASTSTGRHVRMTIKKDGVAYRNVVATVDELLNLDVEWHEMFKAFLHECVKHAGATTLAQAKTAIEAAEWVL